MFKDLVESSGRSEPRSRTSLFVSCFVHGVFLLILLLVPLLHYETLPAQILTRVIPPDPPPPPPLPPLPPPASQTARRAAQTEVSLPDFTVPTQIPDTIPPPEMGEIPDLAALNSGHRGVPEGVGFGPVTQGVWVPGNTLAPSPPPPPPPPPAVEKTPIRVTTGIQSAKLIRRVEPTYPPLAVRARVQGPVHLQLTIDEVGTVAEVRIISGNLMLVEAAVDAVWKWKYSPTLLNGEPVPVIATVTVNFVLK